MKRRTTGQAWLLEGCLVLAVVCGGLGGHGLLAAESGPASGAFGKPEIVSFRVSAQGEALLEVRVPPGYRSVILEEAESADPAAVWEGTVASLLTGGPASVHFRVPVEDTSEMGLFRVRAGSSPELPSSSREARDHLRLLYESGGSLIPEERKVVHLLNRIAYGPSPGDYERVKRIGIRAYIEEQLRPETIDESNNVDLRAAMDGLHFASDPLAGEILAPFGDRIRYFKGTKAPPSSWTATAFNDSSWGEGRTPIGTGHGDVWTNLTDLVGGYPSVYVRQRFQVDDPSRFLGLNLTMFFDDGFVAYLNGVEVARHKVEGNPPAHTATATGRGGFDSFTPDSPYFQLGPAALAQLRTGTNVLAFQIHNQSIGNSDFFGAAELRGLTELVEGPGRSADLLAESVHARGVYSRRQLQAILGEFWENHFTTNYDKLAAFLDGHPAYAPVSIQSKLAALRLEHQREIEALRLEQEEYRFFLRNGLGHFGDLLLFSATSPTMLVYLDNVLNKVGAPNENYAREILELHSLGVDHGYTQTDIEQLARCFTGWTIRKVNDAAAKPFPRSATEPYVTPSQQVVAEEVLLGAGSSWKYFKGIDEPSPDSSGRATANWAQPEFPASGWFSGKAPFGHGSFTNDSRRPEIPFQTVLDDMRGNYQTLYLRANFVMPTLAQDEDLVLHLQFDDGFVAYLNGAMIGRSASLWKYGFPTDRFQNFLRQPLDDGGIRIPLSELGPLLKPAPASNTIAVEFHNAELPSPTFHAFPTLLKVRYAADSIAETRADGRWVFRFDPEQHDRSEKVLFAGTPNEIRIPANRIGASGVRDALDVVEALPGRIETARFICMKLINRFVSDDLSLANYHDGTAPDHLVGLLDAAVDAWFSTERPGHIATVLEVILDPERQMSPLWQESAVWAKVKSPVEYVNSLLRALDADFAASGLATRTRDMGMWMFRREEPDGFPESGDKWVDTLTLRERIRLAQGLVINKTGGATSWDRTRFIQDHGLDDLEGFLAWADGRLFGGLLDDHRKQILRDFANHTESGAPSPFESLSSSARENRIARCLSLILSMPEFQYQ